MEFRKNNTHTVKHVAAAWKKQTSIICLSICVCSSYCLPIAH